MHRNECLKLVDRVTTGLVGSAWGWWGHHRVGVLTMGLIINTLINISYWICWRSCHWIPDTTDWMLEIKERKCVGALPFDLLAAFDKLDSNILCEKLKEWGLTGWESESLNKILRDWKQIVKINNVRSSKFDILSTLLFELYMCSLELWTRTRTVTRKDDTTILMTRNNYEQLKDRSGKNI